MLLSEKLKNITGLKNQLPLLVVSGVDARFCLRYEVIPGDRFDLPLPWLLLCEDMGDSMKGTTLSGPPPPPPLEPPTNRTAVINL